MDDGVEDVHWEHRFVRFCRAREERTHGQIVGPCGGGCVLLTRLAVHPCTDDRLPSHDRPRHPWGGIVPAHLYALGGASAGKLRADGHADGTIVAAAALP